MTAISTPSLGWPPASIEHSLRLVRNESAVDLAADPASVHAYVTRPMRWHEWHPATRSVDAMADRPLLRGDTLVEHISVAGRRFSAEWTVLEAVAPHLWVIATDTAQGSARIAYRITPLPLADGRSGAHFHRTLECCSKPLLWRWLDPLMMRAVLAPQSRRALANLKRVIEAQA